MVVIEVPLPELLVAFDCSSLIASSSGEDVLVEAASHKGLKIWKPPPTHEHGSCCEVQKKGVGRVEKAQNDIPSARRLVLRCKPKKFPGFTCHISQNLSTLMPCCCSMSRAAQSMETSRPSSRNMDAKRKAALVMASSLASKPYPKLKAKRCGRMRR